MYILYQIRGLAIKFTDWCEKRKKKNTRKSKIVLFLLKVMTAYLNTCVELFKKFLKTVVKSSSKEQRSVWSSHFSWCLQYCETFPLRVVLALSYLYQAMEAQTFSRQLTEGSEVSLMRWPPFTPMQIPGTHFC
jgi:hypothetical protein